METFGRWIPVAGWIISGILERNRLWPGERTIDDQLARRPASAFNQWPDGEHAAVARTIIDCCTEACRWKYPYFVPEDPFRIMIRWEAGEMCELDALHRIGTAFELSLDAGLIERLLTMTFDEVVRLIVSHRERDK